MGFGVTEMLIILAIVLVIFGAGKLPSVMGDLAKGVRNFKAGMKEDSRPPPSPTPAPPIAQLTGAKEEGDRSASA